MLVLKVADIVVDVINVGHTLHLKQLILSQLLVKGRPLALVVHFATLVCVLLSLFVVLLHWVLNDIATVVIVRKG